MAGNKAANHKWQPAHGTPGPSTVSPKEKPKTRKIGASRGNSPFIAPPKRIQFPQAKGKVVKNIEFTSTAEGQSISINFRDETCLNFDIVTGLTLKTDYSDFSRGEQRILRRWRPIHS